MPIGKVEQEKLELQMTSMIDVVFLLLVFFIVTLKIPKEEQLIETDLPKAKGGGKTSAEQEEREEFEDVLLTLVPDNIHAGRAKVLVNGQHVPYVNAKGEQSAEANGYCQPFSFDITSVVKQNANNQVAIIGTRNFLNELGTGGLLGPVVTYAEK